MTDEYPLHKMAINEMAMSRSAWKVKVEGALMGAFGESMCSIIADKMKFHNPWEKEIRKLSSRVNSLLSKEETHVSFKNMRRAFNEVIRESAPELKVNYAKHKLSDYHREQYDKIFRLDFNAIKEFDDFIKNYIDTSHME
jgi:hypothetical protein